MVMHKITRMLIVLATLTPVTGFAQIAQQFSVNQSDNRVLAFEVIPTLRAKTGWKISMEEPIWPPVASAVNPGMTRQGEKITSPPAERVALPPVSLLGSSAPAAVINPL